MSGFETYTERQEEIAGLQLRDASQAEQFARLLGSNGWTLTYPPGGRFTLELDGGRILQRGDWLVREADDADPHSPYYGEPPTIVGWLDFREKWQKKA